MYLRLNAPDKARALFEQVAADRAGAVSETGYPLKPFAELQLAELAANTNSGSTETAAVVNRLCAEVVFHPTTLSPALLGRASLLDRGAGETVSNWMAVWQAHEGARSLQARWALAEPAMATNGVWPGRARWLNLGGDTNWLAISQASPNNLETAGHWVAALSESRVARIIEAAIQSAALPEYLGIRVEIAGKRAWGEAKEGQPLAAESIPVQQRALPRGGETITLVRGEGQPEAAFRLILYLATPEALFGRQRVRTLWFASLIAVSMGVVVIGFLTAWRSFGRQRQLSEMKSGFVSSVSHELRAPIAAIELMAEELEEIGARDEISREYHHLIKRECRRLAALIENVLDFSRHDQGRKEYCFEATDLVKLVEETVKVMQPHGSGHHLTIQTVIQGNPAPVEADGRALQQALVNLIDNAVKHSPEHSNVTVGLDFDSAGGAAGGERPAVRTDGKVGIWVEDHGPGIPPEEHEAIFERFYRRGSELRRETQGIGLGLAIVKYVVEAHGGVVRVRSAVGQGSRFTLEIPLTNGRLTEE
jgi:signal transduction histidine kinase